MHTMYAVGKSPLPEDYRIMTHRHKERSKLREEEGRGKREGSKRGKYQYKACYYTVTPCTQLLEAPSQNVHAYMYIDYRIMIHT